MYTHRNIPVAGEDLEEAEALFHEACHIQIEETVVFLGFNDWRSWSFMMKSTFCLVLMMCFVAVNSYHTFLGTNVGRKLIYHYDASYHASPFRKRVEYLNFIIPAGSQNFGKVIQGILACDMTHTSATANVTGGGLGFTSMTLRMKSERGKSLHYDVRGYVPLPWLFNQCKDSCLYGLDDYECGLKMDRTRLGEKKRYYLLSTLLACLDFVGLLSPSNTDVCPACNIIFTFHLLSQYHTRQVRDRTLTTFFYTNQVGSVHVRGIGRQLLYHYDALYQARPFVRRIQNLSFRIPPTPEYDGKVIQGIMAYDLLNSNATARVTVGGVNEAFMNIRMKGARGRDLHYDVYVYI
ncbi:hypothetical protein EVAR_7086_1 [Eumeta japonica]|uniref:Uncharacterized protein n=1 Tax=Eumeta variegata TaxID=151549 RepID=A0A4C1YD87_EUMVA|nr:hypothetical protein EVAR_7086_1 [Eumeta japonica]